MRRATSGTEWLLSKRGVVIGISLGSDFCAEHEVGIKGLRSALGVAAKFENGIQDRINTKLPPTFNFNEYKTPSGEDAAWLIVGSSRYERVLANDFPIYLRSESDFMRSLSKNKKDHSDNMVCAWDEDGAIIHVRTTKEVERLKELVQAFEKNGVALGGDLINRQKYFEASGIIFVIADRVPAEIVKRTLIKDQSKMRLRAAASDLGLEEQLKRAGKHWYALIPSWKDSKEEDIVFFLNPTDQSKYQSGSYTPDQLLQWAKDEGPVVIDKPLQHLQYKYSRLLEEMGNKIFEEGFERPWLHIEWKDGNKKSFAVKVSYPLVNSENRARVDEGLFELEDLSSRFPVKNKRHPKV